MLQQSSTSKLHCALSNRSVGTDADSAKYMMPRGHTYKGNQLGGKATYNLSINISIEGFNSSVLYILSLVPQTLGMWLRPLETTLPQY